MFKVNQYFDGKVTSMAYDNEEGPATIGIMDKGEYEFDTSTVEYMTVTGGALTVLLPGETEWKTYKPYETFIVEKGRVFKVRTEAPSSYKCVYK